MKLLTIVGARPQFIKAGALSRVLKNYPSIEEIIVHTGQHYDYDMSDIFFLEMDIPRPHHSLSISNLGHGAMTGRMMEGLETIIMSERPDCVLVYGDTNSTLAGALAAKKIHFPVIHVEAGLRSFNMTMPEEINRILTDRISDILFCPTQKAISNLSAEGFDSFDCKVIYSGDVMEDAARHYASVLGDDLSLLDKLKVYSNQYVLATIHRQENVDSALDLKEIFAALDEMHKCWPVIVPLHPRTKIKIQSLGISTNVRLIEPLGYFDMIRLIRNAKIIMTDSGGLQKEAYFFEKFCVTLRQETEWVELVEHGVNMLAGSNKNNILEAANTLFDKKWPTKTSLYGGGNACQTIAETLNNL